MKKYLIILLLLIRFGPIANAQTFSEWFKQKKTQKKYLIQQIAALQVYIGYLQKGYKVAKQGLNAISDFKNGEFNLHKNYFSSLENVNPSVKNYVKVAGIMALQVEIAKIYRKTYRQVRECRSFTGDEISYIHRVFVRLLDNCTGITHELITLTSSGELEMKDDERLKRIDQLYDDMQDNYTFSQSFSNQAMVLAAARAKHRNDIRVSRALNGIKNK